MAEEFRPRSRYFTQSIVGMEVGHPGMVIGTRTGSIMKIPGLSERLIEERAERGSILRGKEYYYDGAVKALKRRSDTVVEAFVQGTDVVPYRVDIRQDANGITSAECTCPYVTGSWCRHIVAALYAVVGGDVARARPLSELLEAFDREELIRLVERIAAEHPSAVPTVEEAHRQKQTG